MKYNTKANRVSAIMNTVNITCTKCNNKYSYEIECGYRGRSKKCPKCNYQDMRK